jgi:Fur family ferric uptake transcriptional regulator
VRRNTRQRDAIQAVLEHARRPMSPGEVLDAARRKIRTLSLATVYRTLKELLGSGAIAAVELPGEPARYELRHAADRHHHHFRCDRCARVFDLDGCAAGIGRLLPRGFAMRGHDITIYGTCAACAG